MPWTHNQKYFVVICILRLDRLVNRDGAVNIFLIPQTVHEQDRDVPWPSGAYPIHRVIAPERVVHGMLQHLPPEADLLEPVTPSKLTCRTRFHVHVVIVKMIGPPLGLILARRLLLIYVSHVLLAEGAIVKPVIAHPTVHHGIHGYGHFECWMMLHQRHQRQEAIVRNSEDANLAVALRNIFHQPVDGVVSRCVVMMLWRIPLPG